MAFDTQQMRGEGHIAASAEVLRQAGRQVSRGRCLRLLWLQGGGAGRCPRVRQREKPTALASLAG